MGPENEAEGLVMLKGIVEILDHLADGPCIASSGYMLAAKLWATNKRHIFRIARHQLEPHFLIHLLCRIDLEHHMLLEDLFEEVQHTGPGVFRISTRGLNWRDERIHKLFEDLRLGQTSGMDLPQHFLLLMGSQQQKKTPRIPDGVGGCGGGGGGGNKKDDRANKKLKISTPNEKRRDKTK